jgi:hypothetical protein
VLREEIWHGNRESLRTHFMTKDSLYLWALQTHGQRRRNYPALLALPEHAHLTAVHLHSPADARRWLATVVKE